MFTDILNFQSSFMRPTHFHFSHLFHVVDEDGVRYSGCIHGVLGSQYGVQHTLHTLQQNLFPPSIQRLQNRRTFGISHQTAHFSRWSVRTGCLLCSGRQVRGLPTSRLLPVPEEDVERCSGSPVVTATTGRRNGDIFEKWGRGRV